MKNKIFDFIGTILLFIGFFFAFLPHSLHAKAGLGEASHLKHVVYGMTLVVTALVILVWNNKALRFMQSKKD